MSAFSVPNPPYPRKKLKNGSAHLMTPQDEPTLTSGTPVLFYTGGLCIEIPNTGTYEMEDETFVSIVRAEDQLSAEIQES